VRFVDLDEAGRKSAGGDHDLGDLFRSLNDRICDRFLEPQVIDDDAQVLA
jgi:hypothetical protein